MSAATLTAPAEVDEVRSVIARAQAGDRTAFGELYQRYQVTVYRYVYRKVGNPTVAEDLTSEVFTKALRGINGFAWQGKDPVVWLVTIAANLIRDHFRLSRTRLEVLSDDAAAGQQRRDLSSGRDSCDQNGPEEMVLASANAASLREAITQLTGAQQQCLALRFFEGLDTHETAERMGITARAVVSLQYRAIQALRDLLPASVLPGAESTGRSTTVASTATRRPVDRTRVAEQPQTTPVIDDVVAVAVAEATSLTDVDDTAELAAPVTAGQDVVEPSTTTTAETTEQVVAPLSGARRRVTRNGAVLVRIGDTRETDSSLLTYLLAGSCTCDRQPLTCHPGSRTPSRSSARADSSRSPLGRLRAAGSATGRLTLAGRSEGRRPGVRSGPPVRHVPPAFATSSPSPPPGRARPDGVRAAAAARTGSSMDLCEWKAVT